MKADQVKQKDLPASSPCFHVNTLPELAEFGLCRPVCDSHLLLLRPHCLAATRGVAQGESCSVAAGLGV